MTTVPNLRLADRECITKRRSCTVLSRPPLMANSKASPSLARSSSLTPSTLAKLRQSLLSLTSLKTTCPMTGRSPPGPRLPPSPSSTRSILSPISGPSKRRALSTRNLSLTLKRLLAGSTALIVCSRRRTPQAAKCSPLRTLANSGSLSKRCALRSKTGTAKSSPRQARASLATLSSAKTRMIELIAPSSWRETKALASPSPPMFSILRFRETTNEPCRTDQAQAACISASL
mmetsp:Transcript_22487/g.30095  ORF Transcript_22487/g.30095 Transcript_22487/m.30095 type:complete len:232 (-) Transcript_22487:53-748(-)